MQHASTARGPRRSRAARGLTITASTAFCSPPCPRAWRRQGAPTPGWCTPASRSRPPSTRRSPGDTIQIEAGIYQEAVCIDHKGLTIVGAGRGEDGTKIVWPDWTRPPTCRRWRRRRAGRQQNSADPERRRHAAGRRLRVCSSSTPTVRCAVRTCRPEPPRQRDRRLGRQRFPRPQDPGLRARPLRHPRRELDRTAASPATPRGSTGVPPTSPTAAPPASPSSDSHESPTPTSRPTTSRGTTSASSPASPAAAAIHAATT